MILLYISLKVKGNERVVHLGAATGGQKKINFSVFVFWTVIDQEIKRSGGESDRSTSSLHPSSSFKFHFSSSPWAQEEGKSSPILSLYKCELPWDSTWAELVSVQHHSRCSLSHSHIARHLFRPRSQLTPTSQVPSHPPLITYKLLAKLKSTLTLCSKVKPFQTNWRCTFVV